ncbi:MAG: hypothetical protein E6J45_14970 [Chloroflexi bacterium]|nr:MAG: hypothetical protein E6J45_14970 [Chloroflexota bacterium]
MAAIFAAGGRQRRRRRTTRRRRDPRRLRLIAGLAVTLVVLIVVGTLLHSGSGGPAKLAIAPSDSAELAPDGPPQVQTLAMAGGLSLDVPITQGRITAIVYHATGATDAIPLQPVGRQRNEGFLARLGDRLFGSGGNDGPSYFVDGGGSGPDTGSVDIGAPAGTSVYSPVDGVVVSVQPYVLNGLQRGSIVQIRPDAAPAVIVTVGNLGRHLGIDVGSAVTASQTRLGSVIDLSKLIDQTVARYTSDAGNHASIQISPAPGASPLL